MRPLDMCPPVVVHTIASRRNIIVGSLRWCIIMVPFHVGYHVKEQIGRSQLRVVGGGLGPKLKDSRKRVRHLNKIMFAHPV